MNSVQGEPENPRTSAELNHAQPLVVYVQQEPPSKSHRWVWAIVVIAVIALVIVAAVWMTGVSSTLNSIHQGVQSNGSSLANQQSQLSGIREHLNSISNALNQLGQELRTWFTQLSQLITKHS